MHILSGVNMMSQELVLVHAEEDKIARVAIGSIPGCPPATPQHSLIMPDEETVYITTDSLPPFRASIIALRVKDIDWDAGTIEVELLQVLPLDVMGAPSDMPNLVQTDESQPIMPWTRPLFTQTHAPTLLPGSSFLYTAHYTDDRLLGFRIRRDGTLEPRVRYSDREVTRQTHGVSFNPNGTVGLGVGYDYDIGELRIHEVDHHTGRLEVARTIPLGTPEEYGAFVHRAVWLDNRYAYLGAMQVGPTSRTRPAEATTSVRHPDPPTPAGDKLVGPSVWLIDTKLNTAECVIRPTDSEAGAGMFRPPSDVAVAAGKLYVAEEDSWTATDLPGGYGTDGYISVWDISDRDKPCFVKRLRPGHELPDDFRNAHTASAMFDEESVFVSSFVSNHLVRIDTATDKVAKVYSAEDGLDMFHGEFAAGRNG
jgi:hypothetical protein